MGAIKNVILHRSSSPLKDFVKLTDQGRNGLNESPRLLSAIMGYTGTVKGYIEEVQRCAWQLQGHPFVGIYSKLEGNMALEKARKAQEDFQKMEALNRSGRPEALLEMDYGFGIPLNAVKIRLGQALAQSMMFYRLGYPADNASMLDNLGAKLLLWLENYGARLFGKQKEAGDIPKVIYYGTPKKHEACFLHMLWLAGCDVLCIDITQNPIGHLTPYGAVFQLIQLGQVSSECAKISFDRVMPPAVQGQRGVSHPTLSPSALRRPRSSSAPRNVGAVSKELSYEELAMLSEAVVMIRVYNAKGQAVGGGSGVVINSTGCIITNFHVVGIGQRYGVVFENDSREYESHNVIKYHSDFDIAIIRVERQTRYLTLANQPLVRGQKVAAIGSPLGLFNTISEGIVSGFRSFREVEMIQFTAPISSGSSGGALLNLKGELVGITTAGYDGQNLNLAVPSTYLTLFAGNFIKG